MVVVIDYGFNIMVILFKEVEIIVIVNFFKKVLVWYISFGGIWEMGVKFDIVVLGSYILSLGFGYNYEVMSGMLMVIFYIVGVVVLYMLKFGSRVKYGDGFVKMV